MDDELSQAIALFNRGRYFAAAERFERCLPLTEPELKDLVGALNRIAAALHLRLHRGGRQSAINLLSQAMFMLEDFKPARGGIDVDRLCAEISGYADELRASPRDQLSGVRYRARLMLERRRAPRIRPPRARS
jgi:hypothetical protein